MGVGQQAQNFDLIPIFSFSVHSKHIKNHSNMLQSSMFLQTPSAIRIKIYSLAGLECPCPIDLAQEGHRNHVLKFLNSKDAPAMTSRYIKNPQEYCFYPRLSKGYHFRSNNVGIRCFCDKLPLRSSMSANRYTRRLREYFTARTNSCFSLVTYRCCLAYQVVPLLL